MRFRCSTVNRVVHAASVTAYTFGDAVRALLQWRRHFVGCSYIWPNPVHVHFAILLQTVRSHSALVQQRLWFFFYRIEWPGQIFMLSFGLFICVTFDRVLLAVSSICGNVMGRADTNTQRSSHSHFGYRRVAGTIYTRRKWQATKKKPKTKAKRNHCANRMEYGVSLKTHVYRFSYIYS